MRFWISESSGTYSTGQALVEYLSTTNKPHVVSVVGPPTSVNVRRREVVDINAISASIAKRIIEWKAPEGESSLSDHKQILFSP